MITKTKGYGIEDVPGVEEIRVEPDGDGVWWVVVFFQGGTMAKTFEPEKLSELATALEHAASLARMEQDRA